MDNGVDDIFKSFVNSKLKQLGMHGSSTFDLEKSLQQSALGKLDGVVDVDTENCLIEGKKKKKEKKKKKHKKEKKAKKHKTDTNTSKTNSISNSQSSANSSSLNIFSRNNETSSSSIEKLPVCLSNSLTCKKEKDSSEFSQLKDKDPQLKDKDPQLKEKDSQLKGKDPQLKEKDSQLKEKDPQLKDKDPQLKEKDSQLKEKDSQLKDKDSNRYSPESPKAHKRSHKKHHHHRSRSRSPKRRRHHHHHRHRSRERSRHRSRRSRSNSPVISSKDKMKLLEIAKANVLAQHQAGVTASHLSLESSALLCSGGASLQQLTGVCKDISDGKREVFKYNKSNESTSKVNHPFQVREAPAISINIKTMVPSVTSKSINDLTKEYPVSCGIQHQCKEVMEGVYGKWEPIEKKDEIKEKKSNGDKKVFSDSSEANELSIKDVIAQRVNAVRTLNTDPNDQDAMRHMAEVQSKLNTWTSSKLVPGQFTGSTGVQPLSKNELNRGLQAWATQLIRG